MLQRMRILGIETSCDETAVCLIEARGDHGADFSFRVLGNALLSQAAIHAEYGGVFPNLAKREHAKNLVPLLEKALEESGGLKPGDGRSAVPAGLASILAHEAELQEPLARFLETHAKPDIDCIAVTAGPGLEPALWVGINFARALASAWDVPVVGVNHMEGHIIISAVEDDHLSAFEFPALALLISGGHTELVLSREWMRYEIVGATRDDAAGEAFDKVARLLELPYPGGPEISRLAGEARTRGLVSRFKLPRPMLHEDNLDFSFAGLKTAVRRIVESESLSDDDKLALAREFEDSVADVLTQKTLTAIDTYGVQTVIVGGGVSANTHIRKTLAEALTNAGRVNLLVPSPELATDNALMIALAGYFHAIKKEFDDPAALRANGNLKLA